MTFLPIVERELRVAARRRSTVWFRVLAALGALVIGAGFLTMSLAVGMGTTRFGSGLFGTLTWLALAAALAAGLFFTADSLSEEKREGTLGFLFLTDLRGYEVVGGKLLATSLRGAYALLGLFPVLAVTLLMGGVTGMQFWKSSLALVNALFCSLTAGLLVSSVCRDSQKGLAGTVLLLLLACAAGPIVDSILAVSRGGGFRPLLSLGSPVYVFWAASAWGRTAYWQGLCLSHLLAWGCFALASLLVPRTWQDRPGKAPGSSGSRTYSWRYGRARVRATQRSKLIEINPVLWLASRERWQSIEVWMVAVFVLCTFTVVATTLPSMVWVVWSQVSWLILVLLYLWAATQASRFFVEARRSGLMELLLVTPLSSQAIVAGQWRALLRTFGLPTSLVLLVQVAGASFAQHTTFRTVLAMAGGYAPSFVLSFLSAAVSALSAAANLVALLWFGMWMGLTSKNGSAATLKTVLLVQVLPWLGISFASASMAGLLMFRRVLSAGAPSNPMSFSYLLVMPGLAAFLTLGKDVAFFLWAREKLNSGFRAEAARLVRTQDKSQAASGPMLNPLPPVTPAQR